MTADVAPMVGIIVVNYFGGDMTMRCLESLERLTWPQDRLAMALIDNGSDHGFVKQLRDRFPELRIVEAGANLGFGGACNRGFEVLQDCEYIALLNNDAIPDPDWIEPLVDVLEADPSLGAAVPKVLLAGRFISIDLRSPAARPGPADPRPLGVQLCGALIDGTDVFADVELVSGFWGWEVDDATIGGPFAWTAGHALAHVPVESSKEVVDLDLALAGPTGRQSSVVVDGHESNIAVASAPRWSRFESVSTIEVVNSAGTVLLADGTVMDRGFRSADDDRWDSSDEVFGWSGAAVLLRVRFLADVGAFDSPYFLYYEDADLSWRGRLRGWRYLYVPRSIVRHDRSATVGARSALAQHFLVRNELLTLAKNAPIAVFARAAWRELAALSSAVRRDVVDRLRRREHPMLTHVAPHARALAATGRLLPRRLLSRRGNGTARQRATTYDQWAQPRVDNGSTDLRYGAQSR